MIYYSVRYTTYYTEKMLFMKRLNKELLSLRTSPPPGVCVEEAEEDMKNWIIRLTAADETVYAGEVFHLAFKFGESYPLDSPEVLIKSNYL